MIDKTKWISNSIDIETGCNNPGAYRIRLIKSGQPVKIRRFKGIDKDGIIVIGCSKNIETRRKQFINASHGKHGHSEGSQWWLVNKFSDFGKYQLKFEFTELETKNKAIEIEKMEIREYFKEHLETPPLNANIPQRKNWLVELGRYQRAHHQTA